MPDDLGLRFAVSRYVSPDRRYLRLLHGNLLRLAEPERTGFFRALGRDAAAVDDAELSLMLGTSSGWRERLTAAWMAGISSRTGLREQIGGLLIESAQVYAGQGYCFALACFATADDADLLRAYLDKYLQRPDLVYDQRWAMSALLHLDKTLGTGFADPYLAPTACGSSGRGRKTRRQGWSGAASTSRRCSHCAPRSQRRERPSPRQRSTKPDSPAPGSH